MDNGYVNIIKEQQRDWCSSLLKVSVLIGIITVSCYYVGLFDPDRIVEGIPSIIGLVIEGLPPDFSNAGDWIKPLLDTLAMSIAGTALALAISLPLGFLGARNISLGGCSPMSTRPR